MADSFPMVEQCALRQAVSIIGNEMFQAPAWTCACGALTSIRYSSGMPMDTCATCDLLREQNS